MNIFEFYKELDEQENKFILSLLKLLLLLFAMVVICYFMSVVLRGGVIEQSDATVVSSTHGNEVDVLSVYDGDTIRVSIDLGFDIHLVNVSVRLYGIDAPELGTDDGKESREKLAEKIGKKARLVSEPKRDKYGRILATIYLGEENLNEWMVEQGYAVEYDGGGR